jgi:ComF family protein
MRPLLDLLDLLWPRHCLACGLFLRAGDAAALPAAGRPAEKIAGGALPASAGISSSAATAPPLGLCPACHARLSAIDPLASCATCARPLAPAASPQPCGRCLADPPAFDRLTALWRYESPLKEVVQAFKFGRLDFLGAHFARALGRALADRQRAERDWRPPDLFVPLPLPWLRRLARGFNQTELLAAPLAREFDRPAPRALARPLFARHQTGRRRAERVRGAPFRVPHPGAVAGRSVLLIDDILTTGATVRGASAALRRAGARRIEVMVLGWTPLEFPALEGDPLPDSSGSGPIPDRPAG